MTPIDIQDRAQYLSLALFAQQIVSVLMEFVDERKSAKLTNTLKEALISLRRAKDPTAFSGSKATAFGSYEQVRTLEEVWSDKDRARAVRMIRAVLHAPDSSRARKVAEQLITLFSDLQNQALWNFEQPKPVSPRVMQRLCQLT
jgi:hypothetical protein